jgi:hypothetical protein
MGSKVESITQFIAKLGMVGSWRVIRVDEGVEAVVDSVYE